MPDPRTIDDILQARTAKIQQLQLSMQQQQLQASLSDPHNQTTSVNLPAAPAIFTLISWNVQTFEAGKSLGNPFVNKVINRVLEALSADVCILLESREDSYINMNSIETGLVGAKGWVQSGDEEDLEDDEEDGNDPEDEGMEDDSDDEDDDDDPMAPDLLHGGEPLRYLQTVTEMTGKHWRPPDRLYVYHPGMVKQLRAIKDWGSEQSLLQKQQGGKKFTKGDEKKLKNLQRKRGNADQSLYQKAAIAGAAQKKLAASYVFCPKLLKGICVTNDRPTNDWKTRVQMDDCLPLRDYYEAQYLDDQLDVRPVGNWNDVVNASPDDNWRFFFSLKRCVSCKEKLGAGDCGTCEDFGAYTTRLANLRQTINSLTFYRCTCQESYSVLVRGSTDIMGSSADGIWMQGKGVRVQTVANRLLMHAPVAKSDSTNPQKVPQAKAGKLLGYQDKKATFYGRCPFLLPIKFWFPYSAEEQIMPVVAFHGPFGASTKAGVQVRSDAMNELMSGEATQGKKLQEVPLAVVAGDFNLDWAPDAPKPDAYQQIANQLYEGFQNLDFQAMITGGVPTSLKSIYGSAKWKTYGPTISGFTSSAYDNCFAKGQILRDHIANAAVIDVISWIQAHLTEFVLPDDDSQKDTLGTLPPMTQAFYIYHKYVSDHLPILLDVAVAGMPDGAMGTNAACTAARQAKNQLLRSQKISAFEVVFEYESVVDFERTDQPADSYAPVQDGAARYHRIVGTIYQQEGKSILIRFEPQTGHIGWLVYELPGRGKLLETLISIFQAGTRIQIDILNPKPCP